MAKTIIVNNTTVNNVTVNTGDTMRVYNSGGFSRNINSPTRPQTAPASTANSW